MITAEFNATALGDGVSNVSAGNITREVIVDPVLDIDAAVTRSRGGARQEITVTAWRECADFLERTAYVENLAAALGTGKGALTVRDATGSKSWSGCLLTSTRELESAGAYVKFECRFIR